MIDSADFPNLTPQNHRVTSPRSPDYNCIAWAAGDTVHWWQPGVYWPPMLASDDYDVAALRSMFESLGFQGCVDGALETRWEKIALYADGAFYTHAARQLPSGKWSSKLGGEEDIEHESPEDLAGGVYCRVVAYMTRELSIPG